MIDSIDVEEFRGIRGCEEPISLTDFTVLIGRNNAGKSSLLESLYLLFGGVDPIFRKDKADRVRNLHASSLVYRYSGSGQARYTANNITCKTTFNLNSVHEIEVGGNKTSGSAHPNYLEKIGIEVEKPNHATFLLSPSYESYYKIIQQLQRYRNDLEKSGLDKDVARFINSTIGDEYTEVYLETLEARKDPGEGDPFWVELDDLGAGILKTIAIFLVVEYIDPGILIWDDMETSLHPSLMSHIVEWLIKKDVQVIASTHSIDVLSTMLDLQPKNANVVQMAKSKEDIVSHDSLNMKELQLIMENAGLDPRYLSEEFEL